MTRAELLELQHALQVHSVYPVGDIQGIISAIDTLAERVDCVNDETLKKRVHATRALHHPYSSNGKKFCQHCNNIGEKVFPWPCPTVISLDGRTREVLIESLLEAIRAKPGISKNEIFETVYGATRNINEALQDLVDQGLIIVRRGPRRRIEHFPTDAKGTL